MKELYNPTVIWAALRINFVSDNVSIRCGLLNNTARSLRKGIVTWFEFFKYWLEQSANKTRVY